MAEGGRIEIPISEYNSLREKVTNLTSEIGKIKEHNLVLRVKLSSIRDLFDDISETSLIQRIFSWKKVISPMNLLIHEKLE